MGGKKQRQQSKQESKDARKKDREIRRKHRQQQKADAFKRYPAYVKFFSDFDREMKESALMLRDVVGDGSCLFRSVADQVDGDESLHRIYRDEACRHMIKHPDFYSLFIDEDEDGTLDKYVKEMLKDGEWGGNLELQAMASCFNMNIVIHRKELDDTIIEPMNQALDKNSKRFTIHLAYFQEEDFEHYTSVRKLGDDSKDPGMLQLARLPQYMGLLASNFRKEEKEEDEQEMMIRLQMEEMGIYDYGKEEEQETKADEQPQVLEEPFPGYPRNKKCKCGSKQAYKNCCYKQYEKVKSMMYQANYDS